MLEKSRKNCYFDAHFHYSQCFEQNSYDFFDEYYGCTCAHSMEEWNLQSINHKGYSNCQLSFGIHPQSAEFVDIEKNIDFLQQLLMKNQIAAIGETGFDYFTEEYKKYRQKQEQMWQLQLELAIKYNKPVIVHCRKANEKLFEYSSALRKIPAVLFHSFMGTTIEAESLLKRGINGYFSFGKQIKNNNKKVIACVSQLPADRLLCETDAPFQHLKSEEKTFISDIKEIYESAFALRKDFSDFSDFSIQMEQNYKRLFQIN